MAQTAATTGAGDAPLTITLKEKMLIVRIHSATENAVFFGPKPGSKPGNRFDAPNGEYRVLYASKRLEGAFVETVLRRPKGRLLRWEFVNQKAWSLLRLERPIRLAKLYDEGLQAYAVDAGELSTDDYATSRALARDIHLKFPMIEGLAYRSRYNNGEICYALFNRVVTSDLTPTRCERFDRNGDTVD